MIQKVFDIYHKEGAAGLAQRTIRKLRGGRITRFGEVRRLVEEKTGIEIGGPSAVFTDFIPVYRHAARIDNCNYAAKTIWETATMPGRTFAFRADRDPGYQYICEASDLSHLPDNVYDFLLSSHTIEHVADPIRALKEWLRVIKPGGAAILLVPHRAHTFDHHRPATTLRHMMDDFANQVDESDQTHLEETLDLIDYSMIPFSRSELHSLGKDVLKTRALHHHTFDEVNFRELLRHSGFEVVRNDFERPHHIFTVALKPA